ncbi:MAG: pilus assembly PilX N-terminal domain-containing protein [Rubrivivax sp.]|nr:pilus assembly PilX N-terminal domain-containing protein [Rubrivivax sp.]
MIRFQPVHRYRKERGVASLIIVAALFFIMAMVAAYANRNLIFEQRTSVNQYRSTQAFEAAEAGLEWAVALLNSGRIDATCQPSADASDTTFRQRYLVVDGSTGLITAADADADGRGTVWPSCVYDGANWSCSCPTEGSPELDAPGGGGPFPAFRLRFTRASTTQPGIVRVDVNACTTLNDDCLDFPSTSQGGEGRASVSMVLALRSGLPALPQAALTVRESLDVSPAAMGVFNAEPATSGVSILAGGSVERDGLRLGSVAGTPGELSVTDNDSGLQRIALVDLDTLSVADFMFGSTFSARPSLYREQPGLMVVEGCDDPCGTDTIRASLSANPGRILWVDGDVDFDNDDDVGALDDPVLLIATGSISFSGAGHVYGFLYSRAPTWTIAGAGNLTGAAIAEGAVAGSATTTIIYDLAVLKRLQFTTGSFVKVPGGWADFRPAP